MDKTKQLGTSSIGRLLLKFSTPAIIAMIVNSIYNVVDRIFIGNFAGEAALAGLTIAFPIMMTIFAFAGLIGMGGTSLLSIKLGEEDTREGSRIFGNTVGLGVILAIITFVTLFFTLDSALVLFGADASTIGPASSYMKIIIFGFFFQMIGFSLNNAIRAEGHPVLAMTAMISSAVTNIILDYLFIVIFGWGVEGAAYATIIGQFVGFIILISFHFRGKSILKPVLEDFIPKLKTTLRIFVVGFATFIGTIGVSLSLTLINRALVKYGGLASVTSMGAINSIFTLFIMPVMGIRQGMQPIIGYNHGAGKHDRVFKTLGIGLTAATIFAVLMFLLIQFFPQIFVEMFLNPGSETFAVAINGLRLYFLSLPIISINLMGVGFYQSTGNGLISMLLGLQILILVPVISILPKLFGLTGVWISYPVADVILVVITTVFLIGSYRRYRREM